MIEADPDGAVELFFDGVNVLETTATGATIGVGLADDAAATLDVGEENKSRGILNLFGNATGANGALINLHVGDAYDSVNEYFTLQVYQDDLTFSSEEGVQYMKFVGGASNKYVKLMYQGLAVVSTDADGLLMAASASIEFNPVPTNDVEWSGEMTTLQVDTNATGIGAALYMESDGNLDESDADAAATMPVRCLALEAGTGAGLKVLMRGFIRDDSWTWTVGGTIYASETTGEMTQTAPAGSGDQVQVLGFATHANRMYFNPEYTLIEVA
jgi:hypothetical protein